VSRAPLFSTYRQGENRVTSSMLAVFQRVGVDLTERVIAGAAGESSLELVSFRDQPSRGGAGVPDGEIAARFRYLIEVKTVPNALRAGSAQLRRHLERLDGSYGDERLLVITPDADEPAAVKALGDPRVMWLSFGAIAQAVDDILADPAEPASEQQRFLLREMTALFEAEGLVGVDDTVVVAARFAYPAYLQAGAYTCQPDRSFRPVSYMGFYADREVKPQIARIRHHEGAVLFSVEVADALVQDESPHRRRMAEVMRAQLTAGVRAEGDTRSMFILSAADDPETVLLEQAVPHRGRGAWTQGQRYTSLERLGNAEDTGDL
jgi:hypothetical protein